MSAINEAVGWNIRIAREGQGMTKGTLTERIGTAPATIYKWEREGFTGTVDQLYAIHKVLGLPLWELVPTSEEAMELMEGEDDDEAF